MPSLMTNIGKGCYIWQPWRIGSPKVVAESLVAAKVQHVSVKYHDGAAKRDNLQPYLDAIRAVDIIVGSWGYVYLRWNPLSEARAARDTVSRYGAAYYLIDAEAYAKLQYASALIFSRALRSYLPDTPIGLASYRYPQWHPTLPWKQLRGGGRCDFDSPQVYWRTGDATHNLNESMRQFSQMTPRLPYALPAGDMYKEHGQKTTPSEVLEFLTLADSKLEIQGCLMWSMDQKYTVPELWAAFASYEWKGAPLPPPPPPPPPGDIPLWIGVVTAHALNVRSGPGVHYKVVDYLSYGDRVEVWAEGSGWLKIDKEASKWVRATYVKKVQ